MSVQEHSGDVIKLPRNGKVANDVIDMLDGAIVELELKNGMNVYCEEDGYVHACWKGEGQNTDPAVNRWRIIKVGHLIELELASGKWKGRNWYYALWGSKGACEMRGTYTNKEIERRRWIVKEVPEYSRTKRPAEICL